jgi:hypothetical protein
MSGRGRQESAMRIDPTGVSAYQVKAGDIPIMQPRQTAEAREPDKDADDTRVAAARPQMNVSEMKKMENQAGLGNTIDTTA